MTGKSVTVIATWNLAPGADATLDYEIPVKATYRFFACGKIGVSFSARLPAKLPPPARFGVRFSVPPSFTSIRWLGLGPHEAYDDRRESARLGFFAGNVTVACADVDIGADAFNSRREGDADADDININAVSMHTPYVFPQENGRRAGPRSALLNLEA